MKKNYQLYIFWRKNINSNTFIEKKVLPAIKKISAVNNPFRLIGCKRKQSKQNSVCVSGAFLTKIYLNFSWFLASVHISESMNGKFWTFLTLQFWHYVWHLISLNNWILFTFQFLTFFEFSICWCAFWWHHGRGDIQVTIFMCVYLCDYLRAKELERV